MEYELYHHGILGQKWGKRNGPPYPLSGSDHSAAEKKAGWHKSLAQYPYNRRLTDDEIREYNKQIRRKAGFLDPKSISGYEKRLNFLVNNLPRNYRLPSIAYKKARQERVRLQDKLKNDTGLVAEEGGYGLSQKDPEHFPNQFDFYVAKPRDERKEKAMDYSYSIANESMYGRRDKEYCKKLISDLSKDGFDVTVKQNKQIINDGHEFCDIVFAKVDVTDRTGDWKWTEKSANYDSNDLRARSKKDTKRYKELINRNNS